MILDTNALSGFLDNLPAAVQALAECDSLEIPVIVAGEYGYGIAQSRNRESYSVALGRLLSRCTVLEIDLDTARHYAAIRLELRTAGTPIPANDVWISALARQHAKPILSRDSHFEFVKGLQLQRW